MKKSILALVIASASIGFGMGAANAEAINEAADVSYGWSNIYVDAIHDGFTDTGADLQGQVGYEGGYIYNKLDVYGFGEHNFSTGTDFYKLSGHYTLSHDFSVYAQGTHLAFGGGADVQAGLVGIGYTGITGSNYAFKPFVGVNLTNGDEGEHKVPMIGWSGFYNLGSGLSVSNWTEIMVDTDKSPVTVNGSFGVWQDLTQRIYVGAQYSYKYDTAGAVGYDDALFLRVGLHL